MGSPLGVVDTICNRTGRRALFAENAIIQFLRNQFTRNPVASRIPMSIAQITAESVQERAALFRISLQLRCESNHGYISPDTQGSDPIIGIEKIFYSQSPHERLPGSRIGENLRSIAQSYDYKLCSAGAYFVTHGENQRFCHQPGVIPHGVSRRQVDDVVSAQFL